MNSNSRRATGPAEWGGPGEGAAGNSQPPAVRRETPRWVRPSTRAGHRERSSAVIYGEPETPRFLAAVQRLKQNKRKRQQQVRQARQRLRATVRQLRVG